MKQIRWYLLLTSLLIFFSCISYLTQIYIFGRVGDTFFYMLQDLSFVPVQVLLVTLIIDKLLQRKEKQSLIKKLNMVIGVFFNEMGNELIEIISSFTKDVDQWSKELQISARWTDKDFISLIKRFRSISYSFHVESKYLIRLKSFLLQKRDFLMKLLENPNLLEHDSFTDLLLAVSHVTDELLHRQTFENLPQSDFEHLQGDIHRAFTQLITEWLTYMNHLKRDYPYLYSIAVRTNPLNPDAHITVTE